MIIAYILNIWNLIGRKEYIIGRTLDLNTVLFKAFVRYFLKFIIHLI